MVISRPRGRPRRPDTPTFPIRATFYLDAETSHALDLLAAANKTDRSSTIRLMVMREYRRLREGTKR